MWILYGILFSISFTFKYANGECPRNRTYYGSRLEYVFKECTIELYCQTNQVINENYLVLWILPDETLITNRDEMLNETFIMDDGTLIILNAQDNHEGQFRCIIIANNTIETSLATVHMAPTHKFSWDDYEIRLVIGGIAASVVLGIFSIGCLIFRFRYKDPNKMKENRAGKIQEYAYANPAMSKDNEHRSSKQSKVDLMVPVYYDPVPGASKANTKL